MIELLGKQITTSSATLASLSFSQKPKELKNAQHSLYLQILFLFSIFSATKQNVNKKKKKKNLDPTNYN